MTQPMQCPVCGEQTLTFRTGAGRFITHKRMQVEVPAEFPLKECSNCHARPISLKTAGQLTPLLDAAYDRRLCELADQSLTQLAKIKPLYVWEQILGFSKGWLSKVREARTPGSQLVMLLRLLANDASREKELCDLWQQPHSETVVTGMSHGVAQELPPPPVPRKVQLTLVQSGSFPNRRAA